MTRTEDDFSVAFYIGPIAVPWYGLLIGIGFLVMTIFCYIEWRKREYSNFDFFILFSVGALVAVFGARWWYLIFNPSDIEGVYSFFTISSGRSILGAVFFSVLWLYYYTKRHASYIQFRVALSIIVPNILIAQSIGRWGNFFQQDVYGQIVDYEDIAFLPDFIVEHMYIDGYYRQPLFLYESILDLLGWALIIGLLKTNKRVEPGVAAGAYLVWYCTTRACMELFRDEQFIMHIGNIPTSFVLSILGIFLGIFLIIYYQFYFYKFRIFHQFYLSLWKVYWYKNFKSSLKLISRKTSYFHFKNSVISNREFYKSQKSKISAQEIGEYYQFLTDD